MSETTSSEPNDQQIGAVETSLYNRMLKNAFAGFLKSAVIGAALGLALGAVAAGLGIFGAGVTAAAGAMHGAAWLAGIAGSFGAVAGIQSTRDTRRYFLIHEGRDVGAEPAKEKVVAVSQERSADKTESPDCGCDHVKKLADSKVKKAQILGRV